MMTSVKRFRGGLVFKAHRLCASLKSRLESQKERAKCGGVLGRFDDDTVVPAPPHNGSGVGQHKDVRPRLLGVIKT